MISYFNPCCENLHRRHLEPFGTCYFCGMKIYKSTFHMLLHMHYSRHLLGYAEIPNVVKHSSSSVSTQRLGQEIS
jgi:hypothetical protein